MRVARSGLRMGLRRASCSGSARLARTKREKKPDSRHLRLDRPVVHGLAAHLPPSPIAPFGPVRAPSDSRPATGIAWPHCKTTSLVTRLVTNQWLVSMSLAKLLAKLLTTRLLTYLLTIFCSAPSAQRAHGVHVTHRSQHGAPRAPQIRGNIQVRRWLRSVPALIHAT